MGDEFKLFGGKGYKLREEPAEGFKFETHSPDLEASRPTIELNSEGDSEVECMDASIQAQGSQPEPVGQFDSALIKAHCEVEELDEEYKYWLKVMLKHRFSMQAEAELEKKRGAMHNLLIEIDAQFGSPCILSDIQAIQDKVKMAMDNHEILAEGFQKFMPSDFEQLAKRLRR